MDSKRLTSSTRLSTTIARERGAGDVLPRSFLSFELMGGSVLPLYLTERDEVWIRFLIDELGARVGRTQGDADGIVSRRLPGLAAAHGRPLSAVSAVRHILEKRLAAPRDERSVQEVIERHNLALFQGLLLRSERVVARARAYPNFVLRMAKRKGLLCSFAMEPGSLAIAIAGPLTLERQTSKYGLALSNFLPALVLTPDWSLDATCHLGRAVRLHADATDPIEGIHALPPVIDVAGDHRLERDVRRLGSHWSIRRETEALEAGPRVFFPDFTLESDDRRVHVEVIGFYTREHVEAQLLALRETGRSNVILCLDESLACAGGNVQADEIVRFRHHIDAERLVQAADRLASRPGKERDTRRKGG